MSCYRVRRPLAALAGALVLSLVLAGGGGGGGVGGGGGGGGGGRSSDHGSGGGSSWRLDGYSDVWTEFGDCIPLGIPDDLYASMDIVAYGTTETDVKVDYIAINTRVGFNGRWRDESGTREKHGPTDFIASRNVDYTVDCDDISPWGDEVSGESWHKARFGYESDQFYTWARLDVP